VTKFRHERKIGLLVAATFISVSFATAIPSHNFGSVAVNAAAATYTLSASITGVTAAPVWSVIGASYSIGSASCTVSGGTATCSVPVSFAPAFPGQQLGAVYAKNSSGTLLATYFLQGAGLASQLVFAPGVANTFAGSTTWGYADGAPAAASFRNPTGLALDQAGNLYVADSVNQVIRKVTSTAVSTVAGSGVSGYTGDNGTAVSAKLNNPTGVAVDAANNLYIADQGNNVIRRVDAVSGLITTVAGGGTTLITASSSSVAATSAILYGPQAVAVDAAGDLFLSSSYYQTVLRVDAGTGFITLYAGNGVGGGTDGLGDGGAATAALLSNPTGLALDGSGNLFIADTGHNMIRVVNATTGVISAVAGNGNYGYTGDAGLAVNATLESPMGVRVDAAGNVYIADYGNSVIRETLAATGTIFTMTGIGTIGYSGDGGLATGAVLYNPTDIVLTPSGVLYIADTANNVVRQVSPVAPALSFGSVVVGVASATQAVTVINRGNQALTFSGYSFGNGFKQVSGLDDCAASTVLQPGGTCTANLAFAPVTAGAGLTNLSFTTNSLGMTGIQSVAMNGTGITGNAPQVTLSASSFSFGTLPTGRSVSQTVTLTNTGTAALAISGATLTGSGTAAFSISTTCGSTLAAAAACQTIVTFAPTVPGTYSATVTFNDFTANSPQAVAVTGTARSAYPTGLVQQWDNQGVLWLLSYSASNGTVAPINWTNTKQGFGSAPDGTPDLIPIDVNGDGALDVVQQWNNNGVLWLLPYISNGGIFSNLNWVNTGQGYGSGPNGRPGLIAMDLNGDGKTDLMQQWNNQGVLWLLPYLSNGSSFSITNWVNTRQGYASYPDGTPGLIPMDINGDGKTDLIQQWNNQGSLWLLPYLSNGTTLTVQNWIVTGQGFGSGPNGTPGLIPIDVNGDGKTDLVQQWNNQGVLWLLPYLSNGSTLTTQNWVNTGQSYATFPGGTPGLIPIDVNGDGKMDLVQQWNNNGVLWLMPYISNGTTFVPSGWINTGQGFGSGPNGTPGLIPMDINGDGKIDLLQQWNNNGTLWLLPYVSNGTTFTITNWVNTGQGYGSGAGGTPGFLGGIYLNRATWAN
jgi:hypothetical protein